jgi:uncharacterized protein (TIGR02757 family)
MENIKELLDIEVLKRNSIDELSDEHPDPLMIAREQRDEYAILTCALFSYGNATQIVKFLKKIPFYLFDKPVSETTIRRELSGLKYRFQTNEDIVQWFLIIQRIRIEEKKRQIYPNPKNNLLKDVFISNYNLEKDILSSIFKSIELINSFLENYNSPGLTFLIGKDGTNSPLKRWNMFLRWMVRKDNLDLGWWSEISRSDLIVPLDVHTFNIGQNLGLIKRKTYDLKSAIELTESLKEFDKEDPVKYDFALYRIGQEKIKI